jgi:hypothetical protein
MPVKVFLAMGDFEYQTARLIVSAGTHRSLYISSLKVKVLIQKIWKIQDISSIFMLIRMLNYLTTREE